ncbi:MBL fold metallo-hydrolase [Aureliella helgolandensis]|uniref:Ribonuclease Z n=1 Tax=Aureliella helgolandensis TaxID=2527968 RepID=A0A518G6D3_9BACT|nr:MBL fold metallo-hydrolase [Aureliella helgolandensis]QDV24124.1 ribonuclease Z [Aureliella helgolandensis]
MHIHCLGTTGYHPSPSRHTACYYLPELSLVLDAGTAAFRLAQCLLSEPKESLDIILSHSHLDHIVGLTFLLDAQAVTSLKRIRVHGEAAKLEAVQKHLYAPALFPVPPDFEFLPFSSGTGQKQIGETKVHWFPLEHPGGALGYILEAKGKRIAYVTDTVSRLDAEYVGELDGCDLLLHECYFGDEHQELAVRTGHSWLSEVTKIVRRVRPRQTLLIHTNPLAEIVGSTLQLSREQREELHIAIPNDEQIVAF